MPQSATVTVLNTAQSPGEKRRTSRRRVLLSGKLVDEAGAFSTDCTIREMSETGARLRMTAPVPPGENIYLIELKTGMAHRVRIAWKCDSDLGVHLEEQMKLKAEPVRDPAKQLRRLWSDAAR